MIKRIVIYNIPVKEKILYNLGQLLEKILTNVVCRKSDIGIFCNKEFIQEIDSILWTFSTNIFLPHDIAASDEKQNFKQPILISDKIEQLNRKILCLFTEKDLFLALDNGNSLDKIEQIIYPVQEEKIDIAKIKEKNISIDIYTKMEKKWVKKSIL